mmetsp:Transcript_4544/g.6345  ORF Transcript_4544/g.6345 Transcript_4544/m.6345 type:complete len:110 (+) Transcript_4544:107-436(+)
MIGQDMEGGESDGTVRLSNEPKSYGKLCLTHSVLFTWENDFVYEKIDDPDTDNERAAKRAKRNLEEQEEEEESPLKTCSAITFLSRVLKTMNEDEGNEPEELATENSDE